MPRTLCFLSSLRANENSCARTHESPVSLRLSDTNVIQQNTHNRQRRLAQLSLRIGFEKSAKTDTISMARARNRYVEERPNRSTAIPTMSIPMGGAA
jgi:hypothetical protein